MRVCLNIMYIYHPHPLTNLTILEMITVISGNFRILHWRYLPYIRPMQRLCIGI